ncbi:squalene/phytoene synthase family protein [uncultured Tateyamaria sp.]|uniref:squalene/phytoene synthase family protein n=1 Tax=Tateyamaria sp. 1078 TaxID=3417464 RepID=UPI00260E2852|nr:squalene/phytoene synthase family protein [uncultured Tateyamaria sp.]
MSLSEAAIACARIVERSDPLRFRTVMAAPLPARAPLFALYAFNAEVSRAPWVTQEAMIAEMRLQWWRDALEEIAEGRPVRAHEVTSPLADVLAPDAAAMLDQLVAARRWDIYRDAFEDQAHFDVYINETAGHLMWAAARVLGATERAENEVRDLAFAAGVAAFLRAVPALADAGRIPLIDGTADGLKALAKRAQARLVRPHVPASARAALWPAIGTRATLARVVSDPMAVADGRLPPGVPPSRLSASVLTGRLWL